MTFWFQPFLGVFIGASAVAVTDLNINNSFRKANHFLCSISSLSVQTLHIEWVSSGKSNTREKSLALHHRLIKRVSVKSPAVLAPPCVCACAHGWVHRCDADVQQEPSSWLRVRRSAAGQACDCSGLPPHPCVNTHVSGWPQKLLSLYLFISCALAEGNRCEVSMRCVALGLALNAACTIGTVELSGEPGLQPRGRPQPKLKPRNTGPIVFDAVNHILASVRDVSMTFSLYSNKTQHKNHFFRLQFGRYSFTDLTGTQTLGWDQTFQWIEQRSVVLYYTTLNNVFYTANNKNNGTKTVGEILAKTAWRVNATVY